MNESLGSLEKKVGDIVAFCRSLREENHALRDRVAGLEREKQSLIGKMEEARRRLEVLMDRLPPEK